MKSRTFAVIANNTLKGDQLTVDKRHNNKRRGSCPRIFDISVSIPRILGGDTFRAPSLPSVQGCTFLAFTRISRSTYQKRRWRWTYFDLDSQPREVRDPRRASAARRVIFAFRFWVSRSACVEPIELAGYEVIIACICERNW